MVLGLLVLTLLGDARSADAQGTGAPARMVDAETVRRRLGVAPEYDGLTGIASVKVAVLDYGFDGIGGGRAYLPANALLVADYDPESVQRWGLGDPLFRKPLEPLNRHGRVMAQIIWGVTGARPEGPRFYLLNANGPTMLRRAVRYAIEQDVNIILFSNVFEGAGNGDGHGPIDRIVDEAIGAGIIWINAAGNDGGWVYEGPVRVLPDGYLRLRNGSDVASLRFRNRLDENRLTITLNWNDYRDTEDAGTDKDLDLYVEDPAGRRIGAAEKVQIQVKAADTRPGPTETANQSRNPRERLVLNDLAASPEVAADPEYTYRIRVRVRRGKFGAGDRVRISLAPEHDAYMPPGSTMPRPAVEFLDASNQGEVSPPADHPLVLTVGDLSPVSSLGPTADGRRKPDVVLQDSRTYLSDGQVSTGSSNAAAYVAGVVAVLKAAEPRLATRHLLRISQAGPKVTVPRGRSALRELRLWQTPIRARLAAIVRDQR